MNEDHIVLIKSDGTIIYENGYEPEEWNEEDEFEEDDIDDFDY